MRFWIRKSDKEAGTVYAGAEHGSVSGFAALPADGRSLLRALGGAGMTLALRALTRQERAQDRATKNARRRERRARKRLDSKRYGGFGGRG